MIAEYLKEKNLILSPKVYHSKLKKEINQLSNLISYKIMDWQEFLENYFFSYSKQTIYFVMKEKQVGYEIALEYLDSLYYLEDKVYSSQKLNELVALKKQLFQENLLKQNPFFTTYLKNTTVLIYGYPRIEPFQEKILKTLSHYQIITEPVKEKPLTVYQFTDIDTEIAFVCEDIRKKLKEIPIEHIKIIRPSSEYIIPMKRIFRWCHLPIDLEETIMLSDTPIGKKVLAELQKNFNLEEVFSLLQQESCEELDSILAIFNAYHSWYPKDPLILEMIAYELQHTKLKQGKKKDCISFVSLEELEDDEYGYLLGFNQENYPKLYQDEDFLSDMMKQELGLFDSNEKNIDSIACFQQNLWKSNHLMLTWKEKTAFDSYHPCFLIDEMKMETIDHPSLTYQISHDFNQIALAKEYDKYEKYGIVSEDLQKLINIYPNLPYRTYHHQFQKIEEPVFLQFLPKPLILSYSSLEEYYHCSFRYYISNILKIKEENQDDFYQNIGNIFHYVLSQAFQENFDFDTAWNMESQKYEFTFTKLIFLEKLKQELKYDIEMIKKQEFYSKLTNHYFEKRFSIPIPNAKNIPVSFTGIVDKICYLEENQQTLAAVVDYKTGTLPSNLNNTIYGIGMQLPIYLYFLKRSNLFPHLEIVGFYLQKVINKEMKRVPGKTFAQLKEQALKLVGYSTDQENLLEKLDCTYQDSQVIAGLKTKKDGFYKTAKVLTKEEFETLDTLVENHIQTACNHILEGDFPINPKKIGKDNIGCEFCSYRDICFYQEDDVVELEKHKDLDFLRSEKNA